MPDFEVHTVHDADTIVVALAGDCDLRSRDEMTAALLAAAQTGRTVTVDLARVSFLDSSGLHALVRAHHAAVERAGALYVVNATGTVATVLEITGILTLLRHPAATVETPDSGQVDHHD